VPGSARPFALHHGASLQSRSVTRGERPSLHSTRTRPAFSSQPSARYLALRVRPNCCKATLLSATWSVLWAFVMSCSAMAKCSDFPGSRAAFVNQSHREPSKERLDAASSGGVAAATAEVDELCREVDTTELIRAPPIARANMVETRLGFCGKASSTRSAGEARPPSTRATSSKCLEFRALGNRVGPIHPGWRPERRAKKANGICELATRRSGEIFSPHFSWHDNDPFYCCALLDPRKFARFEDGSCNRAFFPNWIRGLQLISHLLKSLIA